MCFENQSNIIAQFTSLYCNRLLKNTFNDVILKTTWIIFVPGVYAIEIFSSLQTFLRLHMTASGLLKSPTLLFFLHSKRRRETLSWSFPGHYPSSRIYRCRACEKREHVDRDYLYAASNQMYSVFRREGTEL